MLRLPPQLEMGQIVPGVPCAQSGEYEEELWNLFIHIKKVIVLCALLAMDGSCSATFPLICLWNYDCFWMDLLSYK